MGNILTVNKLKTYFHTEEGIAKAVDGISFAIDEGKILGVVGESGSGKSVTSLSIMQLFQGTTGQIEEGEIILEGENLLEISEKRMEEIRGDKMSMIFQEPMTSLNPVYNIGRQLGNVIKLHNEKMTKAQIKEKSLELLTAVGIPSPEIRIKEYPHQLSGGMRQRVMIAMAIANNPKLIICDEPTTALDVTIQAQILDLIKKLCREHKSAALFITHAMGVIAQIADEVIVMYCGNVMEHADVKELFKNPLHPYTKGLLNSIPRMDKDVEVLSSIDGNVPSLLELPKGCVFAPRCKYCTERCKNEKPELMAAGNNHQVRCFRYEGGSRDE
jgi:oligopeptide/dipeptide ABC transporter ATP-binding protein